MKKILYLLAALALASCSHTPKYEILGTAPDAYEGRTVYFVPMDKRADDPSWRLDSATVSGGAFRFAGDAEGMAIIRMHPLDGYKTQDLLVVTDSGTITVALDTVSMGAGTPQNDALQEWKETLETWRAEYLPLYQQLQEAKTQAPESQPLTPELQALQQRVDSLLEINRAYNRAFVDRWQSHTIGAFLRHRL